MSQTRPGSPYTEEEIKKRIAASAEIGSTDFIIRGGFSTTNFFYLSFTDGNLPKGTQWLGGCYIRADSLDEALALSHALKINPGGEARIFGPISKPGALKPEYEHRLLNKEEIELAHDDDEM